MRIRTEIVEILLTLGILCWLCLCGQAWALNDFTVDPNAIALYNFEAADFITSDWTEVDPGADITLTRYTATWSGLVTRNTDSYVYRDYGAGYFAGDFMHKCVMQFASSSLGNIYFWFLANGVDDAQGIDDAGGDYQGVQLYSGALYLTICENGTLRTDNTAALSTATDYYVTVTRDDDAGANSTGQITVEVHTGDYHPDGTHVDTLTLDCSAGEQNDFRYFYVTESINTGHAYNISGSVRDYYLDGAQAPSFLDFLLDAKGDNDLYDTLDANAVDYKQGSQSGDFDAAVSDNGWIEDSYLDADFPLKNGGVNKRISIVCWFKPEAVVSSATHPLFSKTDTNKRSIMLALSGEASNNWKPSFSIGYSGGGSWETGTPNQLLAAGVWYHIGFTFQDSDKAWHMRLWDDGTQAQYDWTGTATNNINVEDGAVRVGLDNIGSAFDGLIDELVIFNDILTSDQIDDIRGDQEPPGWIGMVHEDDE